MADKIKIEKGIPVPRASAAKYPWHDLDVGDSFLFPKSVSGDTSANNAAAASKRLAPKRFSVRKTTDGYRCWRVR